MPCPQNYSRFQQSQLVTLAGYNSRLRRIPPNKISNYNEDYLEAGSHHLQINENSNDSSLLLNTASSLADAEDHVTIDSESVATSHVDDEEMFEEEFELNASGRRKNKSLKKQTRVSCMEVFN